MKVPKPRELTCPVTVEFEDVDSYGIAHHARLVAFLERARVRLLRDMGIVIDPRRSPVPVLYDFKMRFVRPALMLDNLQVEIRVVAANDYTVDLGYRIRRGSDLIARANTTIAFADLESHGLVPMPEDCLAAIAKWREGAS